MPPTETLSWLVGELRALAGELDSTDSASPLVVAIDQGGHATRALAFDVGGNALAESFAPISTFRSGTDRVEHDALEVAESVRTALADLHQTLGNESQRVVAAGFATQRSSIACWDLRTHKPLAPILSWQDRRNAPFVERLRSQETAVRERTGLVLSPHYGASKMRWCLSEIAAVREAAARQRLAIGPLASWLMHAHLRERPHLIDAANAARTQLLDVNDGDWSQDMLTTFGVAREVLPTVVPNRHPYGHILFGDRYVPVILCTGDQSAMPFAQGRPDAQTVYLNVGTGAFLQRMSEQSATEGLLRSVLWLDERDRTVTHAIEGTVNGAGSALDWLNERVGVDTHRSALALTRSAVVSLTPPVFMNGISGVGSPYWRAQFESRFIGEGSDIERVVAVVESIAFLICVNLERMRAGARRVLASGGLSASDYLCECVATLSALPVERTTLQESTATGLAYLIANEPQAWQPQASIVSFAPQANAALSERFARWRAEMG